MIMRLVVLIFMLLCYCIVNGQEHLNTIVPNNSFEYLTISDYVKLKKTHSNDIFSRYLAFWNGPTLSTPDLFYMLPNEIKDECNQHKDWCNKAFFGKCAAGIIIYGDAFNTKNYREYLQIKLSEPLKPNVKYNLSFYVVNWIINRGSTAGNLGVAFTNAKVDQKTYGVLELKPVFNHEAMITNVGEDWQKIEAVIEVDKDYEYLIIGNFYDNENTKANLVGNYQVEILIDNVQLLDYEKIVDSVRLQRHKLPDSLQTIFFDVKSDLIEKRYINTLKSITAKFKSSPYKVILIKGFADKTGNEGDNLTLSKNRAESVRQQLIKNGVEPSKIKVEYFGENHSTHAAMDKKFSRKVTITFLK